MITPIVITDKKRRGRGFSFGELEKAGISIQKARKLGVLVDKRRKTEYEENIEKLKQLITPAKKKPVKKRPTKAEKKKSEKKPKKKKEPLVPLKEVKGIGKKRAETLEEAGITSANDLVSLSIEEVVKKADLSEKMAKKLKKNAEELF